MTKFEAGQLLILLAKTGSYRVACKKCVFIFYILISGKISDNQSKIDIF